MQQPINGRLLIRVASSKYKHVNTTSDRVQDTSQNTGEVIAVAPDADTMISQLYYHGKVSAEHIMLPSELLGKTVHWMKYAEQNSLFDEKDKDGKPVLSANGRPNQLTLLEYKDIISYEG